MADQQTQRRPGGPFAGIVAWGTKVTAWALATRPVRAWFTPGYGEELSHRIAKALGRARQRVRIASPVITAGPVLGTLAEMAAERRW